MSYVNVSSTENFSLNGTNYNSVEYCRKAFIEVILCILFISRSHDVVQGHVIACYVFPSRDQSEVVIRYYGNGIVDLTTKVQCVCV